NHGNPLMDFTAIRGRTYTILGSTNTTSWSPVSFRLPLEVANGTVMDSYYANGVHRVRAEVIDPATASAKMRVFKLRVQ
ncbi:MAG: hypothetical protein WCL11_09950, partial [Verrucomicrobiota bacterium]